MIGSFIKKVIGSRNDRLVKRMGRTVGKINALAEEMRALTDAQLREKTDIFRQRYADGETLDQLLPEAFAVAREASARVLEMTHFDVQLVGAMVLHQGKIAEMRTGEGKTLVATLAVYLNALSGRGVHVVTVNDYLARRDREWMGPIYEFLGLTVGAIQHDISDADRQQAYACDITYGTNNEFGFDYLRDNMKYRKESMVHRDFHFAIVDEVDSILDLTTDDTLELFAVARDASGNFVGDVEVTWQLEGEIGVLAAGPATSVSLELNEPVRLQHQRSAGPVGKKPAAMRQEGPALGCRQG